MSTREVKQSPLSQGVDEEIVYRLTTTAWGSSPTDPSVEVKDLHDGGSDVTSTVMPTGSPSVSGDAITLPELKSLTKNTQYRVEVKFTLSGRIREAFFIVVATE